MEQLHKIRNLVEPWCEEITEFVTDKIGTDIGLSFMCEEGSGFYLLLIAITTIFFLAFVVASLFKSSNKSKTFLSKLLEVKEISHDTKIFTFGLPNGMKTVGLNIGEHLELE
jgi:tetrahydromethanopterin S-methyltransferase subunit G